MQPTRALAGPASVAVYLAVLAVIQATGWPDWQALAASPEVIAHGEVWLLLTSGLVIDGEPWAQWLVLAGVLIAGLLRFGGRRLWTVGIGAHVGAALIAYLGVLVIWLIDRAQPDVDEPDYGVSVLMAGVLGALATSGGFALLALVGAVSLIGFGVGVADASWLANVEHVLGFIIGATLNIALNRRAEARSGAA